MKSNVITSILNFENFHCTPLIEKAHVQQCMSCRLTNVLCQLITFVPDKKASRNTFTISQNVYLALISLKTEGYKNKGNGYSLNLARNHLGKWEEKAHQ